jgi:murein DD-endopeptidase MepM/ murein hydrolase activator NlpD
MRVLLGFLVALCLLVAVSAVVGAQQPEGPYYEVQPGDSLYSIAEQFGSTVQALQDANGIADPSLLAIGQQLLLPGYEGMTGLLRTRALHPGENLRTLPLLLGNERNVLLQLNRIVNPAALYLAQPVIHLVPGQAEAAPTGQFVLAGSQDTLLGLAVRAGCSPAELALLNGWLGPRVLILAELLYLPGEQPLDALPAPFERIDVSPQHPAQGQPVVVSVAAAAGTAVSGRFAETDLHFAQVADERIGLFGVNAMAAPGVYSVILRASAEGGDSVVLEMRLPVADADYQLQRIVLLSEKAQLLLDEEARAAEEIVIERAVAGFSVEKHWEGRFQPPVPTDYVTTRFGLRRSYNGSAFHSFHGGVDFGGLEGTPIRAPAAGVVALAEELRIRGNATLIDHGHGVYTGYWHQLGLDVTLGQRVQAGEVIGRVGDSGLSTGTHLHWEVWVNAIQVDPMEWLQVEIP